MNAQKDNEHEFKAQAYEAKEYLNELETIIEEDVVPKLNEIAKVIVTVAGVFEESKINQKGVLNRRVEFRYICIPFFVDFMVVPKGSADDFEVEGRIIYGARRPTVERKDKKDKVLFECPVSRKGLIIDPGGIKGKWIIKKEDAKEFIDIHYLILANIWDSALNWVNEYPAN